MAGDVTKLRVDTFVEHVSFCFTSYFRFLAADKETLKRLQHIEELDSNTRDTLFTVIDTFLRDAKAKQTYAA